MTFADGAGCYFHEAIITDMHITIDGKTVRPDGSIDWMGESPQAYDFDAFDRVDTCVLGRVMYPEYEAY